MNELQFRDALFEVVDEFRQDDFTMDETISRILWVASGMKALKKSFNNSKKKGEFFKGNIDDLKELARKYYQIDFEVKQKE